MTEDDFKEIVPVLKGVFAETELGHLVAGEYFTEVESDERVELRPATGKETAIRMLEAFDRHLAVSDHSTYVKAVRLLHAHIPHEEERPEDALFQVLPGEQGFAHDVWLSHCPDLHGLRMQVRDLITAFRSEGEEHK